MQSHHEALKYVSRETYAALEKYISILLFWNLSINLLSRKVIYEEIWSQHILDSLLLLRIIDRNDHTIIDVGSGAGFPGLVLAISGQRQCYLVEKNTKKAAFLTAAAAELGVKAMIFNQCITEFSYSKPRYITSRAVTSVSQLITMTQHLMHNDLEYILHVGKKDIDKELSILSKNWNFQLREFANPYKEECRILAITSLSNK